MNAADRLKAVRLLVARVRSRYGPRVEGERPKGGGGGGGGGGATGQGAAPEQAHADETLRELIRSVLVWEATTTLAELALRRIERAVVDFNELRVCMGEEMERIIGVTYPRVDERVRVLRAALGEIYARQHAVSLAHLEGVSRRAACEYVRTLPAVPEFAAARVCLLRFDHPVMPVDSRLLDRIIKGRTLPSDTTAKDAAAIIEKGVKAAELASAYLALQAWADEGQVPARRSSRPDPLEAIFRSRAVLVARPQTASAPSSPAPASASPSASHTPHAPLASHPNSVAATTGVAGAGATPKSAAAGRSERRASKPSSSPPSPRSAKPKRR